MLTPFSSPFPPLSPIGWSREQAEALRLRLWGRRPPGERGGDVIGGGGVMMSSTGAVTSPPPLPHIPYRRLWVPGGFRSQEAEPEPGA